MICRLLPALLLGMLLVMRLATASPIGPVWSAYPSFKAPCNGTDFGPGIWDCTPGEIRYLTNVGEVRILSIPAVASFDLSPAYPAPVTPIYRAPEVVIPETSTVPEPDTIPLIMLALAGMALWIRRNPR